MPKKTEKPDHTILQENRDYYVERGLWVFTEHYLLKRGYCCGSGCRHCPYRKPAKRKEDSGEPKS